MGPGPKRSPEPAGTVNDTRGGGIIAAAFVQGGQAQQRCCPCFPTFA